ncbi:MAG TPA: winged helix-turn-helix transcriptional regulator [Candidatus Thermoplasmatota archaeon]|nr:winged helix-turn-helix transcriptional regulator [Candidatus Thermoplasmatota archaeon]
MRTVPVLILAFSALAVLPAATAASLDLETRVALGDLVVPVALAGEPVPDATRLVPTSLATAGFGPMHRGEAMAPRASSSEDRGEALTEAVMPALEAAAPASAGAALLGLLAWNGGFARFAFVGLYSRIAPSALLDNAVRERVLAAIKAKPGITIKEITTTCGIGWGTAVYHLDRLEGGKFVTSEKHLTFRRFFAVGDVAAGDRLAVSVLRTATAGRLARYVLERPGSAQKEVCEGLGMGPSLAHKHLARLEEAGLVRKAREGASVRYFPQPALEGLVGARGLGVEAPAAPPAGLPETPAGGPAGFA